MPVPLFEVSLIVIGKIKDQAILSIITDYIHKLNFDIRLSVIELKDSDKTGEAKKITDILKKDPSQHTIAMSEEGKEFTSEQFARYLERAGRKITFVIGGPFGLDDEVKKHSRDCISLSRMTFTHDFARMFLLEQIYRAVSIVKNRGYHK
jgi:23S rRNA (pseudouridine1915-N3)-methyltransferase